MAESERQTGSPEEATPPLCQSFMIPKKEIHMVPDMAKWKRSQAYADYIGFILTLNEGVKGKKLTCEYKVSEPIEKLVELLDTLDRWIDETPPVNQPSRFGNKAFRTWYAKLDQVNTREPFVVVFKEAENLVKTVIPEHVAEAAPEVAVYLKESVGNSTRIDYGTGHEAAFAAFLCCLCKIGVLRVDDQLAIVFKVFNRYLEVMRKLQKTYRMEPAGSQGVWGLDDFQFLPFIWGSSQLIGIEVDCVYNEGLEQEETRRFDIGWYLKDRHLNFFSEHPNLEPRHFVDEKVVNENHKDYMFLECILFITEMKTGPFAEHSNQLWNISAVPSWSKVNQGLIRMYKAEPHSPFIPLYLQLEKVTKHLATLQGRSDQEQLLMQVLPTLIDSDRTSAVLLASSAFSLTLCVARRAAAY
ncbi:Serine/threonine-protein phosphatase 2A activator [Chelonia mydas]|uniref:Serine/threonine-protein phosphatase 2A activator n=1 Tax=Chelonia mydas TaxID=8469 RepID=M7B9P2_CHEMY|nr:Serine/threonine-protein phosphatase 2A activator [Chelonia mydas]